MDTKPLTASVVSSPVTNPPPPPDTESAEPASSTVAVDTSVNDEIRQSRAASLSANSDATDSVTSQAFIIVKHSANLGLDQPVVKHLGFEEYHPDKLLPPLIGHEHAQLVVRVPSVWLTFTNPAVKQRKLWGTDIYTDDSDVVAAIIHTGLYTPPSLHPLLQEYARSTETSNTGSQRIEDRMPDYDLAVTLRVVPRLSRYTGTVRHYLRSRDWEYHDGVSYMVERIDQLPLGQAHGRGCTRKQRSKRVRAFCEARARVMKMQKV